MVYRISSRRGSLPRRCAHSRPCCCIQSGARCLVPAWKSKAAPTPSTSETQASTCAGHPQLLLRRAERTPDDECGALAVIRRSCDAKSSSLGAGDCVATISTPGKRSCSPRASASTTSGVEPNSAWRNRGPPTIEEDRHEIGTGDPLCSLVTESARKPCDRRAVREHCPCPLDGVHHLGVSAGRHQDVHVAEHPVAAVARWARSMTAVAAPVRSLTTNRTPSTLQVEGPPKASVFRTRLSGAATQASSRFWSCPIGLACGTSGGCLYGRVVAGTAALLRFAVPVAAVRVAVAVP